MGMHKRMDGKIFDSTREGGLIESGHSSNSYQYNECVSSPKEIMSRDYFHDVEILVGP
jgi:hypothetical protein